MLTLDPDATPHTIEPEFCLWLKVLSLALLDIRKGTKYRRRGARGWIKSDESGAGSFNWVCEILGFDPAAARLRILNRYQETTISQETEQPSAARMAEFDGQMPRLAPQGDDEGLIH